MGVLFLGDVVSDSDKITFSPSVQGLLLSYENVLCNLEGPVVNGEASSASDKVGPCMFQNRSFVNMLIRSNIKNFGLANNHIFDFGVNAVSKTIEYLNDRSCNVTGICERGKISPLILSLGSHEICVFSLCETHNRGYSSQYSNALSYSSLFDGSLFSLIDEFKSFNRKIIFYVHAGLEGVDIPLPFFRELYKSFIEAGVDMVVGNHPHVIQGMETYKSGIIYYSIGDFVFNSRKVNRFGGVGCGLGLNILNDELIISHHYFYQSQNGFIELIEGNFIFETSLKLSDNDYASMVFLGAYNNQILPLRLFAERRLSSLLPFRTNVSILLRSIFKPVSTKKRGNQFKIHLEENETYRELENFFKLSSNHKVN